MAVVNPFLNYGKHRASSYAARTILLAPRFKMSALGQKQTCASQKARSALPRIATAKADPRKRSGLLWAKSGLMQRSKNAFDYLVGVGEQRGWNSDAKRPGGHEIDARIWSAPEPAGPLVSSRSQSC